MSNDMLGRESALNAVLKSPLAELALRLTGPHADEWSAATARFLRRENPWDKEREILKRELEFRIGATNRFSPAEHFKPGPVPGTSLKIRTVDEKLLQLFETEESAAETRFEKLRLLYATRGTPLRAALTKHGAGTVRLAQAWKIFLAESHLKKFSREDWYTENLFLVVDKNGKPWTLMFWNVDIDGIDSWDIYLYSASTEKRHRRDSLIFCPRAA